MSTNKTPEEIRHAELLAAIKSSVSAINTPLSTLALLALVDEFYSKEDRQKLYAEYADLVAKDSAAHKLLLESEATVDPGMGFDARVQKHGEEAAREHIKPKMDALEAKKAISEQVSDFERKHPMIKRLHRIQHEIGKASWEQ